MTPSPVSDASPLIYLARADRLSLARAIAPVILVPRAVAEEIEAKGENEVAAQALKATRWLEVVEPRPVPSPIREWGLGRGETAALTWANAHPGTLLILDDAEARKGAKMLHLPLIGTLGIILKAKTSGLIDAARPEVERLLEHGMYLSAHVMNDALALVGE
jgi:predicted nucleic acid-binding protein